MNTIALLRGQVRLAQRSFWRNPESAFFNFAMPLGVLLIVGFTTGNDPVEGRDGVRTMTLFVPGVLAFAIVVVAYGNLAATLASQRVDGILKRVRTTPLAPRVYLGGEVVSVLATTLLIALATVVLGAVVFRATPRPAAVPLLAMALTLGAGCFAALGLAMSAAIPTADAAGAITNGTYLPIAMVSGMFTVELRLPHAVDIVLSALPLKALTDCLRWTYDPGPAGAPIGNVAVLAVWFAAGVLVASKTFRWEP